MRVSLTLILLCYVRLTPSLTVGLPPFAFPSVSRLRVVSRLDGGAYGVGDAVAVAEELGDDAPARRDDERLRDARPSVHKRLRHVAARPAEPVANLHLFGERGYVFGRAVRVFRRQPDDLDA